MSDDKGDEDIELAVVAGASNGALEPGSCSFCGRSAADVNCLLAGAGALICDDCVARHKAQLKGEV